MQKARDFGNVRKVEFTRVKCAKIQFFFVEYANLWPCRQRVHGRLNTLTSTGIERV